MVVIILEKYIWNIKVDFYIYKIVIRFEILGILEEF